jgi:hypothetical protein
MNRVFPASISARYCHNAAHDRQVTGASDRHAPLETPTENLTPKAAAIYSPGSMALSNQERIAPSLLLSEITKHARPWLKVSA